MKVISSKNTWYLIFGLIFIFVVTVMAFRIIFKNTEEKLASTANQQTTSRSTLVGQTSTKSNLTYTKVSPSPSASPTNTSVVTRTNTGAAASPSPRSSAKPFFTFFNPTTPSPTPTPTTSLLAQAPSTATASGTVVSQTATPGGQLQVVTDESGATYVTTTKADGSTDSAVVRRPGVRNATGLFELINPPTGFTTDVGDFINRLLRFIMMISVLLVFAQLVWGGLEWITSGGDKAKVEAARNKIIAAVIGLIIVASSFAILQLALNFIGYQSINELFMML